MLFEGLIVHCSHETNIDYQNVIKYGACGPWVAGGARADLRPGVVLEGEPRTGRTMARRVQKTGATRRIAQSAAGDGCELLTTAG